MGVVAVLPVRSPGEGKSHFLGYSLLLVAQR